MTSLYKPIRFIWRVFRNVLCCIPGAKKLLFPPRKLAARFGRGDAEYAWGVFLRHFRMLQEAGFVSAQRILEVGPGRNMGSALLWWTWFIMKGCESTTVVCWDVFKNVAPDSDLYWRDLSLKLLDCLPPGLQPEMKTALGDGLKSVANGGIQPRIIYIVYPMKRFQSELSKGRMLIDLIYSQAALEHVWHIKDLWKILTELTVPGGWHSHRIDLADHGRRDTNYLEMLEWSRLAYWLTMRFVPGATNRWRASHHLKTLEDLGMKVVFAQREQQDRLPVSKQRLSCEFIELPDEELRTTALDVVAVRPLMQC